MHKWSFPINAGESQSLACKHHRSNPFVVPVASKECASCVVFFWILFVSAGLWTIGALNKTGSSLDHTTTMTFYHHNEVPTNVLENQKKPAERTVMVECLSVRIPTSQRKGMFFLDTSKWRIIPTFCCGWSPTHPKKNNNTRWRHWQGTTPQRQDCKKFAMIYKSSIKKHRSQKNAKHMTTLSCQVQHRKNASSIIYMNRTLSP